MKFSKSFWFRQIRMAGVLLIGGGAAGCVGPMGLSPAEERRQQDMIAMEDRLQRMASQIEALQTETGANRADLSALRREQGAGVQSEIRPMQARLDDLDRRLKASDAAREKDREQILNSLSSQMAEILRRGSGGGSVSSASGTRKPKPGGGSVIEHTVKPGESLSRIAAAYGVTIQAIKDENKLTNDVIRAGQTLYVPAP